MGSRQDVVVADVPERSRVEALVGGELAGHLAYRVDGDVVAMLHTDVDPRFEGKGVGSALATTALDDARSRGRRVVPKCPFVRRYVERHPEYADLLVAG